MSKQPITVESNRPASDLDRRARSTKNPAVPSSRRGTARAKSRLYVSSEQEALLAAIIQNPDEDTPRLVYADLLDEIGGESNRARAEFIRLQIQLARAEPGTAPDSVADTRAEELLARFRGVWEAGLRGRDVRRVGFRRGFAEEVEATAQAFIRSGGSWCRKHPLRQVQLHEVIGRLDRLVATPQLDSVRELTLYDDFMDDDLFALAEAPRPRGAGRYPNLESIELYGGNDVPSIGWQGIDALTRCEMPRLRELHATATDVDDDGAEIVATAPWFGQLQSLMLEMSQIGDHGLATLLNANTQNALSSLHLDAGCVTAEGLHALADVPSGASLQVLCLEDNPIGSVNLGRLGAALRKCPRLRLNLQGCPLPKTTLKGLVKRFGNRVLVDERH